jgi:histidyl-tRNA synthetase
MDYYNLTVFEWVTDKLGAQGTLCGGGRYDGLIEMIGGKPAPAVGWGLGIERVVDLLEQEGLSPPQRPWDVYVVIPAASALPQATATAEVLREQGLSVLLHAAGKDGPGSMKSQFKKADASGARHALIFGADELSRGEVAIKPLRDGAAAQRTRPLQQVLAWAQELRDA